MKNELSPLECLRIVKEFALEFIENNLDKRLIIGGCDIIEAALKDYEKQKQLVQTLQDKIYVKEMKYAKQEKALEIIKENLIVSYDDNGKDKPCLVLGVKVDKDKLVIIYETFDKEKIDLLREVLL